MSQQWQIGKTATHITHVDGETVVTYHRTAVVRFNDGRIVLNSGGWRTATTQTRMNQTAHQYGLGFAVFQTDYSWYVDWQGDTLPFVDHMELER